MENELSAREKYEKLLFRRDRLRKEAEQYLQLYLHEFGELLTGLLRVKISCIEKKKIIAFCQAQINRGQRIDVGQMKASIDRQMEIFRRQLQELSDSADACRKLETVTAAEVAAVKSLYRAIAKKIHPDLCPFTAENEMLLSLWNDVVAAYKNNERQRLEELSIQIERCLRDLGQQVEETPIENQEQKIQALEAEIDRILNTDPYQYWLLLDDPLRVEAKKEDLRQETDDFKEYEKTLTAAIAALIEGGAQFTQPWEN